MNGDRMPHLTRGVMMRMRWPILLLVGFLVGCGGSTSPTQSPATTPKSAHVHADGGVAGGTLIEWGVDEYHVELTHDPKTSEVTAYILDGSAKKVVAIPAKEITLSLDGASQVVVPLTPKPQDGDPAGLSSRFVGTHPTLAKEGKLVGSVSGQVNGKGYTGTFKTEPGGKR